ncbi:unnamed protein product [Oikopleura dioica]|uniref:Uncharacterized protein n=1 Tax=Oikopleura dioica TaxID=34765 RepID=E4X7H2_OIKDI|nr:unnamed protein product [Oikopleura dioica]
MEHIGLEKKAFSAESECLPHNKVRRERFTISTTSEGMIAIGGHNSYLGAPQKSTEIYQSGEWSIGPSLPEARYGHQTVVFQNAVFVFGGLVEQDAAILKLDNFQSYWAKVGRMRNPVRLKFNAILKGPEVFIYGGKCEKIGKRKFRKQETYDVCNPQVEIFDLSSYRSKAIEYDFPGNSDAQALLYEEITTENIDDDEKPQPAAIVDTKDEFETNKTEVEYLRNDVDAKEQLEESEEPLELLLDFIESKDNQKNGEIEEAEEFEELEVFPVYTEESESEEYEISIPSLLPSFSLPKGNLQDLLSIRKRPSLFPIEDELFGEDQVSENESEFLGAVQARSGGGNGISCWSCNSADPSTCASSFTTCEYGEVCYLRVEMYDRVTTKISAGCAASDSCEVQKAQNFRFNLPQTLSRLNQCRPLTPFVSSVCRQCCATANCNSNIPSDLNGWL